LTVSAVINAPADEIFHCFTTGPGFVKAMGVANAKVDFRVGGQIRSAYKPETDLDSDQAIVNTILAFEPNRMLAIKPTAPAGSPDWLQAICRTGWNVITLDTLGPDRTRITIVGMGYERGLLFDTAYRFFKQGNTATLELMKKRFGPADAAQRDARAYALLKSCVGGEWKAREVLPNGATLCGRTVWTHLLNDQFIELRGELGDDTAMHPHAQMICGIDAETAAPFFFQIMETGAVARGQLSLLGDQTVGGLLHFTGPDGAADWYITLEFPEPDRYVSNIWKGNAPAGNPTIAVHYARSSMTK